MVRAELKTSHTENERLSSDKDDRIRKLSVFNLLRLFLFIIILLYGYS